MPVQQPRAGGGLGEHPGWGILPGGCCCSRSLLHGQSCPWALLEHLPVGGTCLLPQWPCESVPEEGFTKTTAPKKSHCNQMLGRGRHEGERDDPQAMIRVRMVRCQQDSQGSAPAVAAAARKTWAMRGGVYPAAAAGASQSPLEAWEEQGQGRAACRTLGCAKGMFLCLIPQC